ncbi:hypothetical protein PIB30_095830 [Stylosanthes scabra]|uniref:Aminotransferase-like plant mobile domain-containing protein n=1 Tax=Stylosanthes scabra TaxID=79078 RepID=A0ABU6WU47_9FABA|nr:hypothetical protein [Stylosanthes scabra]
MRQLGGLQHIPTAPLNLDEMHVHDGRFGRGEWYPTFLKGWYDMWDAREEAQLPIFPNADLRPSRQYLRWYFSWARLVLVGRGDHVPHAAGPSSDQPWPSTQTDMAFVTRDGYMVDWVEAFLATSTAGPSSTPLEHPSTFFQGGFPDCSPALQTHPFTQMDQLALHHEQVTPPAVLPLRRGHGDVRPSPCGTGGCLEPPQPRHGCGRRGGQ